MITLKNVQWLDGSTGDYEIPSSHFHEIDATGHTLFPSVIDSHLACGPFKEGGWDETVTHAARGGVTALIDIPISSASPLIAAEEEKEVSQHLEALQIPLSYLHYRNALADPSSRTGIGRLLYITSENVPYDEATWNQVCQIAAREDSPLVVNPWKEHQWWQSDAGDSLLEMAIHYAEKQNTRLYILNIASRHELELIERARARSVLIYAETSLPHLFPLTPSTEEEILWDAIRKGTIEVVGSGYRANVSLTDSFILGQERLPFSHPRFLLSLLLTAYHEGNISLEGIARVSHINIEEIFNIKRRLHDCVLVSLSQQHTLQRVGPSITTPFVMKGWPLYTIANGILFGPHVIE